MTQEQATQTVIARTNEMLKDSRINAIYQSHKTKDEAENWLIKTAIATLMGVQFSK